MSLDTIAAVATPPGRGGVAIVRISGPAVLNICKTCLHQDLTPRVATFCKFLDEQCETIDEGIAIYFPSPHSFTGENILELQGHGSPIVMQQILHRVFQLGARAARPGEFSERAFLNGKIDLTQAEAIADLINASSTQAAKAAMYSLQGEFSKKINALVASLIHLRMYVEAALDFSEEEIDFLQDHKLVEKADHVLHQIDDVLSEAKQGALLREGMTIVIAGKPNAGKSSLLNCLSGRDTAIVTEIPGTTRDVLREEIQLDGLPLHIIDTAGLRETKDVVEQEGIRRAHEEIKKADRLLWIVDITQPQESIHSVCSKFNLPITVVYNKIDLIGKKPGLLQKENHVEIALSAKLQRGVDLLRNHLKDIAGYNNEEGKCIARTRHLVALNQAKSNVIDAIKNIKEKRNSELVAEELRLAQRALNEITGEFTSDDLLGRIFSSFCIGK